MIRRKPNPKTRTFWLPNGTSLPLHFLTSDSPYILTARRHLKTGTILKGCNAEFQIIDCEPVNQDNGVTYFMITARLTPTSPQPQNVPVDEITWD